MVSEAIVCNVRDTKITEFLTKKGIKRKTEEYGLEYHLWITKLIDEGVISTAELNGCLYKELMYGSRRLMRCYDLGSIRKIKRVSDWQGLLDRFECENMNFNAIIETNLTAEEKIKVSAINSQIVDGILERVDLLFVYNMAVKNPETETMTYHYSYIPVSFDMRAKTLTIKVWNREEAILRNAPKDQLDEIFWILVDELGFSIRNSEADPQKVLYRMSKDLFDAFFKQLPNAPQVEQRKMELDQVVDRLITGIPLRNTIRHENITTMRQEVIDVEEEMYKLLQQIVLYDYLSYNRIEDLLGDTDKYISRIRFNDRDNLAASLASEKGMKCIFDAKTFMCVRNSLDLVENVASLVVSFKMKKGLLSVKYDASNQQYLSIHILKDRYYTEEDFELIWGLYKEYECENNAEVSPICVEVTD